MKEITKDEFYDYPEWEILDRLNIFFSKPKIGKIYREPNVTLLIGEKKVIEVIGLTTKESSHFRYAYSPEIMNIHIREYKVYIKYETEVKNKGL